MPVKNQAGSKQKAAAKTPVAVDEVTQKLQSLGVTDQGMIDQIKALGAETEADLVNLNESDLTGIGMKPLQARKVLDQLAPQKVESVAQNQPLSAISFDAVLPAVPDEGSWLQALKAGGVLKVDQSTVIAAIRVMLANRAGFYDILKRLTELMEQFADQSLEPVDETYFKMRQQLTKKSYAEIFEAIEGLDSTYVTEGRKKELIRRLNDHLWPAVMDFYHQLKSWQEAWMQGANNPAMMTNAILSIAGGMSSGAMPPGMMSPPDTGILRDSADAVADAANKVFAGTGAQIVAALAYDASKVKEVLSNPRMPALIGVANHEQMLRKLGVAVSATYPRLETNLTRFVLAIMQAQDQPAGNEELQYFGTLFMLGSQINFDDLGESGSRSKIAGIGEL